jgi:hypothetical protein
MECGSNKIGRKAYRVLSGLLTYMGLEMRKAKEDTNAYNISLWRYGTFDLRHQDQRLDPADFASCKT